MSSFLNSQGSLGLCLSCLVSAMSLPFSLGTLVLLTSKQRYHPLWKAVPGLSSVCTYHLVPPPIFMYWPKIVTVICFVTSSVWRFLSVAFPCQYLIYNNFTFFLFSRQPLEMWLYSWYSCVAFLSHNLSPLMVEFSDDFITYSILVTSGYCLFLYTACPSVGLKLLHSLVWQTVVHISVLASPSWLQS